MNNALTWSKVVPIWVAYSIANLLIAIPVILIAAMSGGFAGLLGHMFGASDAQVSSMGTVVGILAYLAGSIVALKYALSRIYKGFVVTVVPGQR